MFLADTQATTIIAPADGVTDVTKTYLVAEPKKRTTAPHRDLFNKFVLERRAATVIGLSNSVKKKKSKSCIPSMKT